MMRLKEMKRRKDGMCVATKCKAGASAVADGKTFFSKRSTMLELCEEHVLEALEMSEAPPKLGPLQWVELPIEGGSPPAAVVEIEEGGKVEVNPHHPPTNMGSNFLPELAEEMGQEETEAQDAVEAFGAMEIDTKEDLTFAAEMLQEVKGHTKRLTAQRVTVTKPLNDALKAARALFKPALDFYGECERLIKGKMSEAHKAAQKAQRLALAEASVAAQDKDIDAVDEAIEKHTAAAAFPEADGIQYRSVWRYEIEDASLIPREYLTPDTKLIGAHVTHRKGAAVIPGVRVYEDTIIAAKSA